MLNSIKRFIRANTAIFLSIWLVCYIAFSYLAHRYNYQLDITANHSNSLSDSSMKIAQKINQPVSVTAFVSNANQDLINYISILLNKYQNINGLIQLKFIDPTVEPSLVRELNIQREGEILVEYGNRSTHIQQLNEMTFSNTLQVLLSNSERRIAFLSGHGERSTNDGKGSDYSVLLKYLNEKGINVGSISLIENKLTTEDTSLLVIADSRKDYLETELQQIQDYISKGGNILLLTEPGELNSIEILLEQFGLESFNGNIVDPNTQIIGIADPRFVVIPEYGSHPITRDLNLITIFPTSRAMEIIGSEEWETEVLIETLPRTWLEFSEMNDEVTLDTGQDIPGPLIIAVALTRQTDTLEEEMEPLDELDPPALEKPSATELEESEVLAEDTEEKPPADSSPANSARQRVVIMGDADFISNDFIGHGGNLELSMRLINWLTSEDKLLDIPVRIREDKLINLNQKNYYVIGFFFAVLLPLVFAISGYIITRHRKRR